MTASEAELSPVVNIVGEHIALGPLCRDLIPDYRRWGNDFPTARTQGGAPRPWTTERVVSWFEQATANERATWFTIYQRATWRPIGTTHLKDLDWRNRTAEFGVAIGEADARSLGYGTETARLMLDYAFAALGLHNVMLTVYSFNIGGRRAYEKAGFREFGRRRQCDRMGGALWDVVYMDCLASEFASPLLHTIFAPDVPFASFCNWGSGADGAGEYNHDSGAIVRLGCTGGAN